MSSQQDGQIDSELWQGKGEAKMEKATYDDVISPTSKLTQNITTILQCIMFMYLYTHAVRNTTYIYIYIL